MTRERAIEVLKAWDLNWSDNFTANEFEQAFAMAISALSENKGEWIEESDNYGHSSYFCSRCGTQEGKPSDICPNCRARMSNSEKVVKNDT